MLARRILMGWALGGALGLGWVCQQSVADDAPVDFTRDIRPILSGYCFACHGPDEAERQGGFRLDQAESAYAEADSGSQPIVPGDPDLSELVLRIASDDATERMPPPETKKTVSAEELSLLRRWITEGAPYRQHWAFERPVRPELPVVADGAWPRNAIDHFVLARMEAAQLTPAPPADRRTLLRRVTLDLTGLPPTPEQVEAFLADASPDAYERVVQRLLEAPAYGEHMARYWLDAARYGDTHGLHLDNYREMWPYRDWVVRSFNRNQPFDQFGLEQLAGDLLPEPTDDQRIATGFNRCHVTTNEGGSIVDEVEMRNVVDRVVTMGTVFLGLTLDCTRCHDHKYDPLTMEDFYSLYAFFNSLDGNPMDGNAKRHDPTLRTPGPAQRAELAALDHRLAELQRQLDEVAAEVAAESESEVAEWLARGWREDGPERKPEPGRELVWVDDAVPAAGSIVAEGPADKAWQFVAAPAPVFSGQLSVRGKGSGTTQHFFHGAALGLRVQPGDRLFVHVFLDPQDLPRQLMLQWHTGEWSHRVYWGENRIPFGTDGTSSRRQVGSLPEAGRWVRLEVPAAEAELAEGTIISGWAFTQDGGTVYWDRAGVVTDGWHPADADVSFEAWLAYQRREAGAALPGDLRQGLDGGDGPTREQLAALQDYFARQVSRVTRERQQALRQERSALEAERQTLQESFPSTLIYREKAEPQPAFVLNRGEYDQPGQPVSRRTPAILPPMPAAAPRDRLGLARWLFSPEHPLTARVTVNRLWQQLFGVGLVRTAEDFGSQGSPPSHPELLDWLAAQLVADGWDVQQTLRRMVLSATYRQSSRVTPQLLQQDPANRWWARAPRYRLDAERLRDQALSVSGLLHGTLGGPSVKPPQPDGLWFSVGYSGSNTVRFQADTGPEKVHRRSLYTFIKRTSPPPQLSIMDGPSRESCTVRRERTNTPLQALMLMNDPQFFEAARALARRATAHAATPEQRAQAMFQWCTARPPEAGEQRLLLDSYETHRTALASAPQQAADVAGGLPSEASAAEAVELAAWTMVANLLLNMDEVLCKN